VGNTKVDLVNDLRAYPASEARDRLIARAESGVYHDFDSDEVAPKITAVIDLSEAGFAALADKVRNGEYDEPPNAEQLAELREEIGPELFDALMGPKSS
jgi:hypothetical protein